MKTRSVRIPEEQACRIEKLLGVIPGGSLNAVYKRAGELWLDIEGPVYESLVESQNKRKKAD